jgi:hypothetical protein
MATNYIKMARVQRLGHWHKGPVTNQAVLNQVPDSVIKECPARIIAEVADAINTAYHGGRRSMGAELVDGDFVWCEAIGKALPLSILRAIQIQETCETVPCRQINGCGPTTEIRVSRRYTLDATESF